MTKTENSLSENHQVLNIRSLIWPMTAAILIVFWISFMAVSEKHIITENKDNQYTYIEDVVSGKVRRVLSDQAEKFVKSGKFRKV